jgi:hypothetical protein
VPAGRWGATWLVAVALAVCAIGALERLTRAGGQRPSVVDDPYLWSLARRTVGSDPRTIAFLGTSRMALGYSPAAFADAAPGWRAVQLSISNNPPLPVLADLADDESFRGIAVIELIEPEISASFVVGDSQAYVDRAHHLWRAPGALANRFLASLAQSQLAVLAVGGQRILTSLAGSRRWPAPARFAISRDRTVHGDYSRDSSAALRAHSERWVANLPPLLAPDAWLAVMQQHFEPLVRRIQARGGDVVLVHMPISGLLARRVDELYPRARYWDALATHTTAHVLHFRDLPAMANLTCPDDMHLDQTEQAAFTRALVEALLRHHVGPKNSQSRESPGSSSGQVR